MNGIAFNYEKHSFLAMWMHLVVLFTATSVQSTFVHSPSASVLPINPVQNAEVQEKCGQTGGARKVGLNKIDFGELARLGQFPWAAAMEFQDENGKMRRMCSASLISSRHALTAAHCVMDQKKCNADLCATDECQKHPNADKTSDPSKWTIAYGGHCNTLDAIYLDDSCQEDNMKRVGVRAIAWDERYVSTCLSYDMAIVEFERDIELDYELGSIVPICLADPSFPFDGAKMTFYGFGVVEGDNDAIDTLHSLHSQLRYGIAVHTHTMMDGSEMTLDGRLNRTESERQNVPYLPRSQISAGDSGGGISTNSCDGSNVLIGTITRSKYNKTWSYGSVLRTHIDQICEITGVCPKDRCN